MSSRTRVIVWAMQMTSTLLSLDCSPLLLARGVTKSFARGLARNSRRTIAIAEADLELRPGEVVGLCGDEGAGKTTLLQCIAGLLRRDAGVIGVNGSDQCDEFRQWVSYVPAAPVFYSFLTVRDILELRLARTFRTEADDRAVDRAIAALDLESEASCRVGLLQPEAVKRVAVAEAIVTGSRVVLVDTGASALDFRSPMLEALRAYAAKGNAVVISARDAQTLAGSVSRFIFLEKGRTVITGNGERSTENARRATDSRELATGAVLSRAAGLVDPPFEGV